MHPALCGALERGEVRRGDAFAVAPAPTLASGFPVLDAELPGGGWPRGALTELLVEDEGIGELGLLRPALAALTTAGRSVLLLAPPHAPHAPAWAAAGLDLAGLRLVFPRGSRDALWAGVEALRCGGVAATLLWLDDRFRAGLPANSLRRLQVAAGEGGGGAFCFRPAPLTAAASPAPLRLQLQAAPGSSGQLRVQLLKRRGPPARQAILLDVRQPADFSRSISRVVAGPALPAAGERPEPRRDPA